MFHRNENRNEGTFGCSPRTNTLQFLRSGLTCSDAVRDCDLISHQTPPSPPPFNRTALVDRGQACSGHCFASIFCWGTTVLNLLVKGRGPHRSTDRGSSNLAPKMQYREGPQGKRGAVAHSKTLKSDRFPPEVAFQIPERGYVRMFPRNENRNEGTFAKTTLLRNRPFGEKVKSIAFWGS